MSRIRAEAVIQQVAEIGYILNLSPEGTLQGWGLQNSWPQVYPLIKPVYRDVLKILKQIELSGEVNPLGLYELLELSPLAASDPLFKRMKLLRQQGMPFFLAHRIAEKQERANQVAAPAKSLAEQEKRALLRRDSTVVPISRTPSGSPQVVFNQITANKENSGDADNIEGVASYVDPANTYNASLNWINSEFVEDGCRILHYWQGEYWVFKSSKFVALSNEDMRSLAYGYLATRVDPRGSPLQLKKVLIDNFLDGVRAAAKLSDTTAQPAFIDSSRNPSAYIACRNGLLHLATRQLEPSTPVFFNSNALDFDFNPRAAQPLAFLTLLQSIWGDDAESIATLQEFFGYFLTLDTSQQKILLLVGPPRSGKGTIARVLTRLIGAANTCAPTLTALATQFGLQTLIGKQLAIISDARVSGRADISAITENLLRISGEDFVSVPRKFKGDYTSRLPTRFMMLGNELPTLADSSGAFASRFIILRMTKSFYGREDHALDERLDNELASILNWALDGHDRLAARGHFIQPTSSNHLAEQLDSLSSPMKEFLQDCCDIVPGSRIECHVLFMSWQRRCAEQNREQVGTIQTFGKQLIAAAPNVRIIQLRSSETRTRYYDGILLKRTC
jgi:putative DNA primase/helicase